MYRDNYALINFLDFSRLFPIGWPVCEGQTLFVTNISSHQYDELTDLIIVRSVFDMKEFLKLVIYKSWLQAEVVNRKWLKFGQFNITANKFFPFVWQNYARDDVELIFWFLTSQLVISLVMFTYSLFLHNTLIFCAGLVDSFARECLVRGKVYNFKFCVPRRLTD